MEPIKKEIMIKQIVKRTETIEEVVYVITYKDGRGNQYKDVLYDDGIVGSIPPHSGSVFFRMPTKNEKFLVEMNGLRWANRFAVKGW